MGFDFIFVEFLECTAQNKLKEKEHINQRAVCNIQVIIKQSVPLCTRALVKKVKKPLI